MALVVKNPLCPCRRCKRYGFDPWVEKIPWSKNWQPTSVSLPGESHGQRSLAGYSPWGHKELEATEHTQNTVKTTPGSLGCCCGADPWTTLGKLSSCLGRGCLFLLVNSCLCFWATLHENVSINWNVRFSSDSDVLKTPGAGLWARIGFARLFPKSVLTVSMLVVWNEPQRGYPHRARVCWVTGHPGSPKC